MQGDLKADYGTELREVEHAVFVVIVETVDVLQALQPTPIPVGRPGVHEDAAWAKQTCNSHCCTNGGKKTNQKHISKVIWTNHV